MPARAWKPSLEIASVWLASICLIACANDEPSLLGKQCSVSGACLPGYACSDHHVCVPTELVRVEQGHDAAAPNADAGAVAARASNAAIVDAATAAAADGGYADATAASPAEAPPTITAPLPDCVDADRCDGACVDLAHDAQHCGACDRVCSAPANSVPACEAGQCESHCRDDFTSCAGVCVELSSDHAHCGACGSACSAVESCAQGVCVSACPSGTLACGGGCLDTSSDPSNCGSCGHVCPTAELADATCDRGTCGVRCQDGSQDCNGQCANGIVVELARLTGLGTLAPCAALLALDALGSLISVCGAGLHSCNGSCMNLSSDPNHCGQCDTVCAQGQTCNAGACAQP